MHNLWEIRVRAPLSPPTLSVVDASSASAFSDNDDDHQPVGREIGARPASPAKVTTKVARREKRRRRRRSRLLLLSLPAFLAVALPKVGWWCRKRRRVRIARGKRLTTMTVSRKKRTREGKEK